MGADPWSSGGRSAPGDATARHLQWGAVILLVCDAHKQQIAVALKLRLPVACALHASMTRALGASCRCSRCGAHLVGQAWHERTVPLAQQPEVALPAGHLPLHSRPVVTQGVRNPGSCVIREQQRGRGSARGGATRTLQPDNLRGCRDVADPRRLKVPSFASTTACFG